MESTAPASAYSHPQLIQLIQHPPPEYDIAVGAVQGAEALVRDMQQALMQAEQQLAQAQAQLQQTIPAQQEHRQLVQKLQAMQRACWNRSLSAELSGLILGKTSRYNVRMVAVSCPLLRDTVNAAELIRFEVSPWSRARIAAGGHHTLCVNAGGRVHACGNNNLGQLGVGDKENRVVPTLITGLLKTKTVVQVTAGYFHTACLTADGLIFVCGAGVQGQMGIGDTESRVVPTLVRGELEGRKVLQVAAGGAHTVCVTEDGSVFAFGANMNGQLGLGDTENRLVPTLLRGELANKSVVQVAAGGDHTVFVTGDGLVFASGDNDEGQLGVGDTERRVVPMLVTGQLQGKTAVYVAAGDNHTLCITADGSLFSWGANSSSNGYGQLGVGDTEDKHAPTLVTGLQGKRVVHVAAGEDHTICITADGSVFTWGAGLYGKLGLGDNKSDRLLPTLVRGELQYKQVVQVAAGEEHSACVTKDSSVYVWGDNHSGQLGQEDMDDMDGAISTGVGAGVGRQCKCKVKVVPITMKCKSHVWLCI